MYLLKFVFYRIILLSFPVMLYAQESGNMKMTSADYLRAERFLSWNLTGKMYGGSVSPNWIDDDRFWYRNRFSDGFEFIYADLGAGARRRAFDHERLASSLSEATDTTYEPYKLPFTQFEYREDRRAIGFVVDGKEWRCDIENYTCSGPYERVARVPNSVTSPDNTLAAYIKDSNLWIRNLETGEDKQLTNDGKEYYGYATDSQGWTRSDRPILLWSPDSRKIATYRLDERNVEKMPLIEMKEGRPVLHYWPYALPGDTVVPMHERVVIHIEEPSVVYFDIEPDHQRTSNCCGLTRAGNWGDVEWSEDSQRLAFVSTSRDYKEVKLRIADPYSGVIRTVYEERANTFFESNLTTRGIPNWRIFHDRNEFIWFTRRDGWGHLYLYDLNTGALKNRITSGAWNVVDIHQIDKGNRWIYFTAVGKEAGRDPYHEHFYRVRFDGSGLSLLTPELAHHAITVSPSGTYYVDAYSSFDMPPVSVVRRQDGRVVLTLEEADISALEEIGWNPPIPFKAKGRDDITDVYGLLFRPSDFDPEKKYPIINSIYPGPQVGSIGTRNFSIMGRGQTQALAELGFIVVQIDATGTPLRSKAFHTDWYGDMGDNGLEDQIAAMRQLAEKYSWIDLDRVGIYGHSGGGFATASAMLRFPDFFHVGVASAGNHDNRGYTYYWGEKYQGLLERQPDGTDNYEKQANQFLAGNLKGKLLITYGTMDSNVHPSMTLLLINELIKHNKNFDVMVFPNRGHGYFNEPYNIRITWDYFVRHLLGKVPPADHLIKR
jgi:dipeptidyl-peptidase 4